MTRPPALVERVLESFQDPRTERPGQWVARCPAHDDGEKRGKPSLAVTLGDNGAVILKCLAGCSTADVLQSAELDWQDLYPPKNGEIKRPPGRSAPPPMASKSGGRSRRRPAHAAIVATWDYHSADGALAFQVVRFEWDDDSGERCKDYGQRRPSREGDQRYQRDRTSPTGAWTWSVKDCPDLLYRLPDVRQAVEFHERIWLVEGEKCADAVAALGDKARPVVATTNAGGAAKWKSAHTRELKGARVVFVPDSDSAGSAHERKVVPALVGAGAEVRVLRLPGLDATKKEDVVDWLAKQDGTPGEIRDKLDELAARARVVQLDADGKPIRAPLASNSDPTWAHALIDEEFDGAAIFDEGDLYRLEGNVWTPVNDLYQRISEHDGRACYAAEGEVKRVALKHTRILNIAAAIHRLSERPGYFGEAPEGCAFADSFVRLDQTSGQPVIEPLTPDHRVRFALPFKVGDDLRWGPRAPRWAQYLAEVLAPDPHMLETAQTLQEFAGAALFGLATRYQKCLIIPGGGDNGKGVFTQVFEAMFPDRFTRHVSPHEWGERFGLAPLIGARLNVVGELPGSRLRSPERFKGVIAGDRQTAELKNKPHTDFVPVAAHLFTCNHLHGTSDHSFGYWRRFLVVPFLRQFALSEQDKGLARHIIDNELHGVALWAIAGAARLLKQNRYTESPTSIDAKAVWRRESDTVRLWLDERCKVLTEDQQEERRFAGMVPGSPGETLWEDFKGWLRACNYRPMGKRTFFKQLNGLRLDDGDRIERKQPNVKIAGQWRRVWCFPLLLVEGGAS